MQSISSATENLNSQCFGKTEMANPLNQNVDIMSKSILAPHKWSLWPLSRVKADLTSPFDDATLVHLEYNLENLQN